MEPPESYDDLRSVSPSKTRAPAGGNQPNIV